ncbi:hypothetical protein PE36_22645 [Moritella sp. PE36]|uniref:hypothetical protein n=1 Tax=Moritella sp. PE36 TaxID=58051 RepID=UPI0001568E05|nr:hypothetical protein [Moritella sp. PE36]EDM64710.1 hypothetical protein PE36_22645 [Moritella sp. PE36]
MPEIRYEISTTEIKPFTYKTPLVSVDSNGELQLTHSKSADGDVHVKTITFLNLVGRNEAGDMVSFEPMDYVNRFLMAHHIEEDREESAQYAKALVHYFSYIIALQEAWDKEYDEYLFDELIDLPRPRWDFMPSRKSQRPTYMYRDAVKKSVTEPGDNQKPLAKTTASAYVRGVIKFYSFHLIIGYEFNNKPFQHEIVTINFEAPETSMKAYLSKKSIQQTFV